MLKKSIIIFFLLLSELISAQGFKVKRYIPGSLNNSSKTIFEVAPSQYIGGGFTIDPVLGTRLTLTGIDSVGNSKWIKHYGDTSFQHVDNFLITRYFMKHGNNLYYTGALRDKNPRAFGILIKFNFNGDTLWQKIFRSNDTLEDLIPQRVTASVDGGFLITGWFQDWGNHSNKLLIIKTDANGNELWRKQIPKNSPNVQDGKAIIQDSATKKIAIVGYQYLVSNTGFNTYDNIVILDSIGNYITSTSRIIGLGGSLVDLIQTRDKKLVACGSKIVSTVNSGVTDMVKSYALKFDINSPYSPIWTIDDFDDLNIGNGFTSVDELSNGDLIFGGGIDTGAYTVFTNSFQRIAKFNKDGNLIYKKYYNYKTNGATNANSQGMMSLMHTSDGGMIATIAENNTNPNPFFFVKYDANGCDTTLAYCNTLLFDNVLQKENSLFTVFPNPANDFIYLQFIGQHSNHPYTIKIINCIDEVLLNLSVNPMLQNKQGINISHLKSGLYLLQVWVDDKMLSIQKLIKN